MAKEPKTGKFKKGELVRVVTPLAFVRCGYPLDPAEVQEQVSREQAGRIRDFLRMGKPESPDGPYDDWMDSRARIYATKALASQVLTEKGFGGRERRIHTQEMPEIKGRVFKVTGWQFNKTGSYVPPSTYGGGWDGPAEYEPGYLSGERTHRILHLLATDSSFLTLKIEACHVEKVAD